ncbi:hypothetical protein RhiirC2_780929 [Rhizophagus irregularis]|uniref:Uncharacterized protein n=1 Tax=Rhizophagus irregularis TaxID=588596 RepID=A0A2N1N6L2_9GLOM|nr:hypothetical protein RhiirC2_780929 [Rhizophagus irregularis]
MAHSFQIRCRILLAEFKVRMLKLERGAITAISNGGGRVAAATTVVIRSWIIRNIFVVSNFCDKILLIHVFWLVGRGVKQLSQLLWNVSGQMNKDMNVNGHYLITSTFREDAVSYGSSHPDPLSSSSSNLTNNNLEFMKVILMTYNFYKKDIG